MRSVAIPSLSSRFAASLPADPVQENYSRQVADALYSHVQPEKVSAPRILLYSPSLAEEFSWDEKFCSSEQFAALMSGNALFPGSRPYASRYGGHQFGHWAGQLGDGRAINLGELPARDGSLLTLQLKGAGPTPYSRGADGRAVLRSSAREFLCSEAMHFLGVPTTRALSLVLTGDEVVRDMFYDGNPQQEPGAIVCRVAQSFTRFGHFQLCAYRGEIDLLRLLIHQCLHDDFPELKVSAPGAGDFPSADVLLHWFEDVCHSTAEMIARWMSLGFVHGVMNTDNMSILGQTIDYGPYGWLDHYDPGWTPNTTDAQIRRYRYEQQPDIALWNLYQLANALLPVIEDVGSVERILKSWPDNYEDAWLSLMRGKLGLSQQETEDSAMLNELLVLLQLQETDMTIFFRALSALDPRGEPGELLRIVGEAFYDEKGPELGHLTRWLEWEQRYRQRLQRDPLSPETRRQSMNRSNPWFILRNYLVQEALDQAHEGDYRGLQQLHEALQTPYVEQVRYPGFHRRRPEWARHRAGASMLSCSS